MLGFGGDPRDKIIELLENERDHLRALLTDRDKQILAMSNTSAFRLLNPHADPLPVPLPPGPMERRGTDYVPEFSVAEIKAKFPEDS